MLTTGLRRGFAGGLLGGILAGLFALLVGQAPMNAAIAREDAAHEHDADLAGTAVTDGDRREGVGNVEEHEHLVPRVAQQALLPVATTIVGLALGGLHGVAFALLRPHVRAATHWTANFRLGLTAWAVVVLAPLLTFPPSPPGVGDPAGVGSSTQGYLLVMVVAAALAIGTWRLSDRLRRIGWSRAPRQVAVLVAGVVAGGALLCVLPSGPPVDHGYPAELLWQFRLAAVGTQTVLWCGIVVGSGLLWARDAKEPLESII